MPTSADRSEPAWERPMGAALSKGVRRLCPNCGRASMFSGYLAIHDSCPECGQELHHHRADDAHMWLTILITGHLIGPIILYVATTYELSDLTHMILWPALTAVTALAILPLAKGFVIAFQWARRMHGFAGDS